MSFLFKLTIAILIVFAILFPILISSDNKLSVDLPLYFQTSVIT